jgi:hypothetical protein
MNINQLTKKAAFAPVFIVCLNLLALLLWFVQARTMASKGNPVVIKHFLPRDKDDGIRSASFVLKENASRQQLLFHLRGTVSDEKEFRAIQAAALSLKTRQERNSMIKITLSEETHYKDVIALINIVMRTDLKRYMLWKNDFYILPPGAVG